MNKHPGEGAGSWTPIHTHLQCRGLQPLPSSQATMGTAEIIFSSVGTERRGCLHSCICSHPCRDQPQLGLG